MKLNENGHSRKIVKCAVLLVGKSGNIAEIGKESVGLPTEKKLDLCVGETHAVEDDAGAHA